MTDSKWMSKKDREALQKREEELRSKRHASRRDQKVTLDFAGRRVVSEENFVDVYNVNDSVIQEVHYGRSSGQGHSDRAEFTEDDFKDTLINPTVLEVPQVSHTLLSHFASLISNLAR